MKWFVLFVLFTLGGLGAPFLSGISPTMARQVVCVCLSFGCFMCAAYYAYKFIVGDKS